MARFLCRTCAWNTTPPRWSASNWTSNSPRATTARAHLLKKRKRDSLSTLCEKTLRASAVSSTNAKSPRRSLRYEHSAIAACRGPGARVYRDRGAFSLPCGIAFWILRRAAIPRIHRRALGQAHHLVLEQTPGRPACAELPLRAGRHLLSPVLPKTLQTNRSRKPPQPARA